MLRRLLKKYEFNPDSGDEVGDTIVQSRVNTDFEKTLALGEVTAYIGVSSEKFGDQSYEISGFVLNSDDRNVYLQVPSGSMSIPLYENGGFGTHLKALFNRDSEGSPQYFFMSGVTSRIQTIPCGSFTRSVTPQKKSLLSKLRSFFLTN